MWVVHVVDAGAGAVSSLLGCAWSLLGRLGEPLAAPLLRLAGPVGNSLARFVGGVEEPAGGLARDAGDRERLGGTREHVEETKFWLGPTAEAPAPPASDRETGALPRAYGVDRAVLLPRDPWSMFAFWEVTPVTRIEALRTLGAEAEGATGVLRIHVLEGGTAGFSDVDVPAGADRWHLEARPATGYQLQVGIRTRRGRFVALATSPATWTPPSGPSTDTAVRWMDLDRDRPALATSVVPPPGASPPVPAPLATPATWAPPTGGRSSEMRPSR